MIQRIQSLFLLIAFIATVMVFFFPVASITEFTEVQSELLETDYYFTIHQDLNSRALLF